SRIDYLNSHPIRNKQNLEAAAPAAQKSFRAFLAEVSADKQKTHDYLLRTSMIASLREAAKITA
nr:hypothetical protein [Alphaproteobacteria bacterium]